MGARLLYATPTGKHPHPGYVTSMRDLEMSCASFERRPEDFAMACGPVQMARSEIAERALRGVCKVPHDHTADGANCKLEPYDYLIMHDDDLVVNAAGPFGNPLDLWHELFEKNPEVGVIGAVYLRERMDTPTIVISHPEYPEEHCHLVYGMPYGPFEVGGVGTGFMMIRVSLLRALKTKEAGAHTMFRFPFNRTRWGTVNSTGEDYDFCARARGAGFKVLADSRIETVHIKETGALRFNHHAYEAEWSDNSPIALAKAQKLKESFEPGIGAIQIGPYMCLDHVQKLKAEAAANELAERRATAAPKEAA